MSDKSETSSSLTNETIERDGTTWLRIFKYHESGTIVQIQNDAVYRIPALLDNHKLIQKTLGSHFKKFLLVYIYLEEKNLEEAIKSSLLEVLQKNKITLPSNYNNSSFSSLLISLQKKNYQIGVFISNTRSLFSQKKREQEINNLETNLRLHNNFMVLVFTSIDISHPKYEHLVGHCSSLFTHLLKYPLYSKNDSKQFIDYNCKLWKMSLKSKMINKVIENCGGYLWLIRQAIRYLRDHPLADWEEVVNQDIMMKKVESIWSKITPEEKMILKKVNNNTLDKKDLHTHEYQYLLQIRLVKIDKHQPMLGLPLFKLKINKEESIHLFNVYNNQIFHNGKNVSHLFTPQELNLLLYFVNHEDLLITRDCVAEIIWNSSVEEKYSDWAIDKLIYRLRTKLKQLEIRPNILRSLKSRGFIYGSNI